MVVRTIKDVPADFLAARDGYEAVIHQGQTYYRPKAFVPGQFPPKMPTYRATATVLLMGDESEIQRIIEKGGKQTRRPEFDFIETSPHLILVTLGKAGSPAEVQASQPAPGGPAGHGGAMHGQPAVGMPAGMTAIPASLSGGKLKGSYLGITFTQDLELLAGLNCPESATDARAELEQSINKLKGEFASQKDKLAALSMIGLGDAVPIIESIVNSFGVTAAGPIVQVTAKIPGSIKTVFDKAGPAMMGLSGMGGPAGGIPAGPATENPFGAAPIDASAVLGDPAAADVGKLSSDAPTGTP
jgi:hypothetical protein